MKLKVEGSIIVTPHGRIRAEYPVIEARLVKNAVLVIYDYMSFQLDGPARNLFAYDIVGTILWRAKDIGFGSADAYTGFISEEPLIVANFAGFGCTLNIQTGEVADAQFTK